VGKTLKEPFVDGSVSVRSQTPNQQWTQTPLVAFGNRVALAQHISLDLLETAMENDGFKAQWLLP
jgi:hypothetical protein